MKTAFSSLIAIIFIRAIIRIFSLSSEGWKADSVAEFRTPRRPDDKLRKFAAERRRRRRRDGPTTISISSFPKRAHGLHMFRKRREWAVWTCAAHARTGAIVLMAVPLVERDAMWCARLHRGRDDGNDSCCVVKRRFRNPPLIAGAFNHPRSLYLTENGEKRRGRPRGFTEGAIPYRDIRHSRSESRSEDSDRGVCYIYWTIYITVSA